MANSILSGSRGQTELRGFHGIDRTEPVKGAYSCRNFRILANGSLEKRDDVSYLTALPGDPRAVWSGKLGGKEVFYCLVDNDIYDVSLSGGEPVRFATVSSVDGGAEFFYLDGALYLIDGEELYRISPSGEQRVSGYVPLYGKGWDPIFGGKVNEPVNFLDKKIIIQYERKEAGPILQLGIKCKGLISCNVNGRQSSGVLSLSEDGMFLNVVGTIPDVCDVTVLLELDEGEYRRSELTAARRGAVYSGDGCRRVMLYGGGAGGQVFVSRSVDPHSVNRSRLFAASCDNVYFPVSDAFSFGDGDEPIMTVIPYFDGMLIFGESSAFTVELAGNSIPRTVPSDSRVGCFSPLGAAVSGKYAYTVSRDGIFKWSSPKNRVGYCECSCISDPIAELLSEDFYKGSVVGCYPRYGEVWFSDPGTDEGRVFVYQEDRGVWYTFDFIYADRFVKVDGKLASVSDSVLRVFGKRDKVGISAEYVSGELDMDMPLELKRVRRVSGRCKCKGEDITLTLRGDRGRSLSRMTLKDSGWRGVYFFDRRVNTGRFGRMYFILSASGLGQCRIDGITFSVFK